MALAKVPLSGTATLNGSPTAVAITATPVPAASERPAFSLTAPDVQTLTVPSTGALAGLTLDVPGPAGTWPLDGVTYLISATAGGVTNTFQVYLNDAVRKLDLSGELTFSKKAATDFPVDSVNGETGAVVLTAADVSADPAGAADDAVSAHEAAADPHPNYATEAALTSGLAGKAAAADLTALEARVAALEAAAGGA